MKRFISYPRYKRGIIKVFLCIFLLLLGFILAIKALFNSYQNSNNKTKIDTLLAISSSNVIGNISFLDIANIKLTKPETLLNMTFNNIGEISSKKQEKVKVIKEVSNKTEDEPIIYIYNTHQTEEYASDGLKNYNIIPTVYMASNILKKKLSDLHIESVVEDENIVDVLHKNNWSYNDSYKASWQWLEKAKKDYPSLKYFIDIHRDSNSGKVTINDVPYAKMMFVVGMNHENYQKNEELAIKLNNYLNENYNGLMRNIFYGKRSQYNQHFDSNCLLIEIGGPENNIDEVNNSVAALADAINNLIGGL